MERRLGDAPNAIHASAYGSLTDFYRRSDGTNIAYFPDANNFTDQANLTCAWYAYVDVLRMSYYALKETEKDMPSSSYLRYFNVSERQDVQKVYSAILGPPDHGTFGSPLTTGGRLHLNYGESMSSSNACDGNTASGGISAFFSGPENGQAQIVLCPSMFLEWHTPCAADAILCENMGSYANGGWDSIASVMLHEFAHWAGAMDSSVGFYASDWKGDSETSPPADGYGSYNAMKVNVMGRGGSRNAENYSKFAQEAYYSARCSIAKLNDPPNPDSPVGRREVRNHPYHAL